MSENVQPNGEPGTPQHGGFDEPDKTATAREKAAHPDAGQGDVSNAARFPMGVGGDGQPRDLEENA